MWICWPQAEKAPVRRAFVPGAPGRRGCRKRHRDLGRERGKAVFTPSACARRHGLSRRAGRHFRGDHWVIGKSLPVRLRKQNHRLPSWTRNRGAKRARDVRRSLQKVPEISGPRSNPGSGAGKRAQSSTREVAGRHPRRSRKAAQTQAGVVAGDPQQSCRCRLPSVAPRETAEAMLAGRHSGRGNGRQGAPDRARTCVSAQPAPGKVSRLPSVS